MPGIKLFSEKKLISPGPTDTYFSLFSSTGDKCSTAVDLHVRDGDEVWGKGMVESGGERWGYVTIRKGLTSVNLFVHGLSVAGAKELRDALDKIITHIEGGE